MESGRLQLVETECFIDEDGETAGDHRLTEGELVVEGDTISVWYRWTGPGFGEDTMSICEVDNVLTRTE